MTTHQYRFFNECGIDGWLVVEGVSSDSPVAVSMSSKYVFDVESKHLGFHTRTVSESESERWAGGPGKGKEHKFRSSPFAKIL